MTEEDDSADALREAAYGIFEIILNKELKRRGSYLFDRVEKGEDFSDEFREIFSDFSADYPDLAGALNNDPAVIDSIYTKICEGEGVLPTKTELMYWIVQDRPGYIPAPDEDEKAGKWLIFLDKDETDEMWVKIRNATVKGLLGFSAKVSTAKENPDSRDERFVIYVYTPDWSNEEEVINIREELKKLGVEQRIGYKRNIETYHGEYSTPGKKVTYYSI
jgi:hypothetical protein